MSKDEREKRAKKKRREDPNPNRKGKAKIVREAVDATKYGGPERLLQKLVDDKKKRGEKDGGGLVIPLQKAHYEPEGEVVSEEEADRLRDQRMERGGVGGNQRYDRPARNVSSGGQSKPKPHPTKKSAIETVAAELRARYGGSAVIGGTLKKKGS